MIYFLSLVSCLKVKRFVDATVESPKTLSGSEKNKQLSYTKVNSEEVDDLSIVTKKENEASTFNNSQQINEKQTDDVTGKFVSVFKNMFISQSVNCLQQQNKRI